MLLQTHTRTSHLCARTIGYYLYTKSFYASAHPISWKGRTEKESAILPWTSCVSREGAKIVPKANQLVT